MYWEYTKSTWCTYNRQQKSPTPFWEFQLLCQVVLKMLFIKNYENFEELQKT